ncbi:hypothetical protein Zmor_023680 [Zophobas morio]|uniref:Metalloendopeptidase n=1 Tax=Zophobas morio TaxID=2755281 RepID=A0AA38HZ16_9CUCU|nr:hypothetical protein Zmor_023680 [Zophobas morio]
MYLFRKKLRNLEKRFTNINLLIKTNSSNKSRDETKGKRAVTAHDDKLWDYGVIPYEIDETFTGRKDVLKQAMRHWENFTCIKFVERNNQEHPDYIYFAEMSCGCCSSYVGRKGDGGQAMSIGPNCNFGNILHELGHAIGFWHEHSRPDRDNHVKIIKENIRRGWENNFNKLKEEEVTTLGSLYDYDSIMHYSRNGFSKGVYLDTIQPVDLENVVHDIGQRIRLSEGDIQQTNRLYKCPKCGQTFQQNSGTFSSTNNKEQNCEWRITTTNGEKIVLTILKLDIGQSPDCNNYIEIRDGYWYKSPLLKKLCGGNKTKTVISTGSRMLISSFTKDPKKYYSFTLKYEVICGGQIFIENEEHIESPNYPDDYEANKKCTWKITVPKNYKVALEFSFFEMENHGGCLYDYVEIRDGFSTDSKLLGLYCGHTLPPNIISTTENLLLKFVSDASIHKGGFAATVFKEYDKCAILDHGCAHNCVNTLEGYECVCKIGFELQPDGKSCKSTCGGILEASSGSISSPSFPETYPPSKKCFWEIVTQKDHRVVLNFTHFNLEGNSIDYVHHMCDYDKLEVYSKLNEGEIKKHGTFCGSKIPQPITSESNILKIIFSSDDSMQKSGFSASFFTDLDECSTNNGNCQHGCTNTIGSYRCICPEGYTLHKNNHNCTKGDCFYEISSPFGRIQSPKYPDVYPNRKTCVWKFTTLPGHRVCVSFLFFRVEYQEECFYDRVELYDGLSSGDRTLGKFCGDRLPEPLTSSGTDLYMTFKTDASTQRKGFWGTYSTVCGGVLQAETREKYIYSHVQFGVGNYGNDIDCTWIVKADYGFGVRLAFSSFDIEDDVDCLYDYVEIFSEKKSNSFARGRYCGNVKPTDLLFNDVVVLRFRTDDSFGRTGFKLIYQSDKSVMKHILKKQ